MKKLLFTLLLSIGISISFIPATYALHHQQPITWKGQKYEYLVEFPTDIQHVDPLRMEEMLNTAGMHGWKLISVTSEFHFYAFYFERPLLDHKLTAHRNRIARSKANREKKHAVIQTVIKEAHEAKMALENKK